MSEAKGPGMGSDGAEIAWNRWILSLDVIRPGTDMSFDTFVAGYAAGRASRDGLREAAESAMIAMDLKKHRAPRGFFNMLNPALEALDKALAKDAEGK